MAETLLELSGISKTYPGVRALDDVNLSVYRGEVLGLIGENGAGKSTLMRVLAGVIAPSEGVIRISGNGHARMTVSEATRAGIAFVHQELNLFENLDVAANVFIGREKLTGGPLKLVDNAEMAARVGPLLERLGGDFTARHAGRGPVDRAAPDGGDRQGVFDRCPRHHHGRADLEPDPV